MQRHGDKKDSLRVMQNAFSRPTPQDSREAEQTLEMVGMALPTAYPKSYDKAKDDMFQIAKEDVMFPRV